MKFSEIWYVDASQQQKMSQFFILDFDLFWPFLTKKQPEKQSKIFLQNPNRLMKFSEIWYVDAS